MYGFAAVPPTPAGHKLARQLFEAAWPQYPSVLGRIKEGADGLCPEPRPVFDNVMALLKFCGPISLKLVVFVGCLEENARVKDALEVLV